MQSEKRAIEGASTGVAGWLLQAVRPTRRANDERMRFMV